MRALLLILPCLLSVTASAQTGIGVNDLRDLPDADLGDGVCDVDLAAPGNQCTLRAAVENANLIGGWVAIQVPPGLYSLSFWGTDDVSRWGDLDVYSGSLTRLDLNGSGPGTVIDAQALASQGFPDRVLHITNGVSNQAEIYVSDLTLQGGNGVNLGAGIRHEGGKLVLTDVTISGCNAFDDGGGLYTNSLGDCEIASSQIGPGNRALNGGGVFVQSAAPAQTLLSGSTVTGNDATLKGGGLRVASGAHAVLSSSDVGANTAGQGGGVNSRGTLDVTGGSISSNQASGTGGGLSNEIGARLTLLVTTLSQNTGQNGGGLANSGDVHAEATTFDQNTATLNGGGISNSASLFLDSCTLSHNTAQGSAGGGGGLHGFGSFELRNTTISGNMATNGPGGGVYVLGSGANQMSAVTIAFNWSQSSGAGVFADNVFGPTSVTVTGVLLDQNHDFNGLSSNFAGAHPMVSAGSNLDSDGTCLLFDPTDQSGGAGFHLDAALAPLTPNGGPTATHELLPYSPAIDRGACVDTAGNVLAVDQRGVPRPGPCDTGAYERDVPPGQPLCFASNGPGCPCGNQPFAADEGCVHSAGHGMRITSSGSTSVTQDNLVVTALGCPPVNTGLFYAGTADLSPGQPLYDGLQCAGGNVRRFQGRFQSTGQVSDTGFVAQDPSGVYFQPGVTYFFQYWSRDVSAPSPCGTHANFSPGLQVTAGP